MEMLLTKGLNFIVLLQIKAKRYAHYPKRLMVKTLSEKNVVLVQQCLESGYLDLRF